MARGAQVAIPSDRSLAASVTWGLSGAASVLFVAIGVLVSSGWTPLIALDDDVTRALVVRGVGSDVDALRAVTSLGSATVRIIVVASLAIWLTVGRRWRLVVFTVVAALSVSPLTQALKAAFDRPRPAVPGTGFFAGTSFPSGHSSGSAMLAGVLVVVSWNVAGWRVARVCVVLGVVLAGAVGYSRIALGAHFLTDVIAGWLLGAVVVLVLASLCDVRPRSASRSSAINTPAVMGT